jgi:hypothetical protein
MRRSLLIASGVMMSLATLLAPSASAKPVVPASLARSSNWACIAVDGSPHAWCLVNPLPQAQSANR